MNVIESISNKLALMPDLTKDEQVRLVYIEACKLFSFDYRFKYLRLLGEQGKSLLSELQSKKIDLTNLDDFIVNCKGFSICFKELLKELIDYDAELINLSAHYYNGLKSAYGLIIADGSQGDLARVKYGLRTRRYTPEKMIDSWDEHLMEMDKKIGYCRGLYPTIEGFILYEHNYVKDETFKIGDRHLSDEYLVREVSKFNELEIFRRLSRILTNMKDEIISYDMAQFIINYALSHNELFPSKVDLFKVDEDNNFTYEMVYVLDSTNDIYLLHEVDGIWSLDTYEVEELKTNIQPFMGVYKRELIEKLY